MLKRTPIEMREGTSYQGKFVAQYEDLLRVLGPPTSLGDGYKVDVEWVLLTEDDRIITIYNWKNGPNYLGRGRVEGITTWNIGGKDDSVVETIKKELE